MAELQGEGWTLAALAYELDNHVTTLEKWKAGTNNPNNAKAVLMALDGLKSKRPPPKRRYPDGHYMQRRKQEAD